jgi:SAM-dependent methyltransferase
MAATSHQTHRSDARVLSRRTLARDHPCLLQVLAPGMRVLDVGCGVGAIAAGIARAVAPSGSVCGIDRDEGLLAAARRDHGHVTNLSFEQRDVLSLEPSRSFDVVTASRTLQWVADVPAALQRMQAAARPGGWLVVLDYVHAENTWAPAPPPAFATFYQAFLDWRAVLGWDNRLGARLEALFEATGLREIRAYDADEIAERGAPDFEDAVEIWVSVIRNLGRQLVESGSIDEAACRAAEDAYRTFIRSGLLRQRLRLRCALGRTPPGAG